MPIEKVVYDGTTAAGISGTLFEGQKFWLSQTVPQRSRFKDLIQVTQFLNVKMQEAQMLCPV
jgi:hypothetical protein